MTARRLPLADWWFMFLLRACWVLAWLPAVAAAQSTGLKAGWVRVDRATLVLQSDASQAIAPRDVNLPFHWDRMIGRVDGVASFRAAVSWPPHEGPLAVYFPRIGNAYAVFINGHEITRAGQWPPGPGNGTEREPQFVSVPPELRSENMRLEVHIATSAGRYGGVSEIYVGDAQALETEFLTRRFWEVASRQILGALTTVLGVFGLWLWWRGRDAVYLYYGGAELLWTAITVRTLVDPIPMPMVLWQLLFYYVPLCLAPPLMYRAIAHMLRLEHPWLQRALLGASWGAVPVALIAALFDWRAPFFAWSALLNVLLVALMVQVAYLAYRRPNLENLATAALMFGLTVTALRDAAYVLLSPDSYTAYAWLRFSWPLLGLAFLIIVGERLRAASAALTQWNVTLQHRLDARDAELQAAFAREREREKARGVAEERQRLMRDLHDGLGSQLVGALRVAQRTTTSREDVVLQLRESIDQLKLTVDAMQETDGDIAALLGTVRYRLAPRLEAAGVALHWNVAELPALPHWGVREAHQLQMILLEIFSNMIVHSGARNAGLEASPVRDAQGQCVLRVRIHDDGCGFDPNALPTAGHGLANLRRRAAQLQVAVDLHSQPGGTEYVLSIPLPG